MKYEKLFDKWYIYGIIAVIISIFLLGIIYSDCSGKGWDMSGPCFLIILSFLPVLFLTTILPEPLLPFLVIIQFFIIGSLIGLIIIKIKQYIKSKEKKL